jgi:hypothetical protein
VFVYVLERIANVQALSRVGLVAANTENKLAIPSIKIVVNIVIREVLL